MGRIVNHVGQAGVERFAQPANLNCLRQVPSLFGDQEAMRNVIAAADRLAG